MSEFYTPNNVATSTHKDRGSKFIAYLFPISSEDEVKERLIELKAEHKKARHICYAFRLGFDGELERLNDDGEPSGSAGLPILNQLHSANLSNAGLFVVRYFGGTKLGMAGLIKAYKESSKMAIEDARKKPLVPKTLITITFPITSVGDVERVIHSTNCVLVKSNFDSNCTFYIEVNDNSKEKLMSMLNSMDKVTFKVD